MQQYGYDEHELPCGLQSRHRCVDVYEMTKGLKGEEEKEKKQIEMMDR